MAALSEEMKKHNGIFFEEAKSGDPTHKIPGCENFVENMIAAMRITGCKDNDDILKKCGVWVRRAHYEYYENKDVNKAVDFCNAVMQELTFMGYDTKLVSANPKSFMYSEVKT